MGRRFRIYDGSNPGYDRVPLGDVSKRPDGDAFVGSPILNEAQAARVYEYAPPASSGPSMPSSTVLFMPLTTSLSVVTPVGRPLLASTPFVAGRTAPNGQGSARIGYGDGCGWRMNAAGISDFGMGDFTVSLWAYVPSAGGQFSSILTTQDVAPYHWTLQFYRYQTGKVYIAGPYGDIYICGSLLGAYDGWHHYAWTKKANVSRFFIDGAKVSEGPLADFNSATATIESGLWSLMNNPVDTQQLLVAKEALWDAAFTPPNYL